MYAPDPFSRLCLNCNNDRVPETHHVKEGRQRYIVYTCRICKHSDIERWADRPRSQIWDGKHFLDADFDFEERDAD